MFYVEKELEVCVLGPHDCDLSPQDSVLMTVFESLYDTLFLLPHGHVPHGYPPHGPLPQGNTQGAV